MGVTRPDRPLLAGKGGQGVYKRRGKGESEKGSGEGRGGGCWGSLSWRKCRQVRLFPSSGSVFPDLRDDDQKNSWR